MPYSKSSPNVLVNSARNIKATKVTKAFPAYVGSCLLLVLSSLSAAAQDKDSQQNKEPIAILSGQPIYEDDLSAPDRAQIERMETQVFAVRRRALQAVVTRKVLEAEAKKGGMTPEELMKSQVDSKIPDPTSDEVSQYYQAHQGQSNQPFDQAKENIAKTLKDQALQKARLAYMQTLMQRAVNDNNFTVLISPPKVKIPFDPQRLKGNSRAPVTIVEFSDFSCPYCAKAELTVTELLAKYSGKVKVGYRDFPLRQLHPQAQLAAEASRCAGEQNKYWEYHDLLFANREKQDRSDLVGYASSLKLDSKQFETCLSTGRYKPQIEEDVRLGNAVGIISTPGFLVNGRFLGGARPLADFERIVNEELSKPPEK